ncbi:hypothetical protein [Alteriqipengyuania sp.]|uniref:hypothetical protein n=1 Tax=Alteriqipengyuania sp. TaxID=2800692 RepID=UPI00351899B8
MNKYSLRIWGGSAKPSTTISFEGEDAHEAFSIMERKKLSGPAELYEGQRSLGTIAQTQEGAWILESRQNAGSSHSERQV